MPALGSPVELPPVFGVRGAWTEEMRLAPRMLRADIFFCAEGRELAYSFSCLICW